MKLTIFHDGQFFIGLVEYTKNKKGLLYLLFCWTGIPGVIGMVEGILALLKPSDDKNNIEIN